MKYLLTYMSRAIYLNINIVRSYFDIITCAHVYTYMYISYMYNT